MLRPPAFLLTLLRTIQIFLSGKLVQVRTQSDQWKYEVKFKISFDE